MWSDLLSSVTAVWDIGTLIVGDKIGEGTSIFVELLAVSNLFSVTELQLESGVVAEVVTDGCSSTSKAGDGEAVLFELFLNEQSSNDENGKIRGGGWGLNVTKLFSGPQMSS